MPALLSSKTWAQAPAIAQATLPSVTISERRAPPTADVTGFSDFPLAQQPLSASVISNNQIEASGARRLADLLKLDASTADAYNAAGYWDFISVRGFTLDNRYNYRREGLPISAETSIALDNKERVEILKGTSGIQAGTSAPGGLVNYVVKRPTENDLRSLRVETANYGGVLVALDLGGRFGEGNAFGYRLNLAGEDVASPIDSLDGKRHLFALAADWRLNKNSLLEAEVEYSRRSQPSLPGLSVTGNTLPAPNPYLNINNQPWSQPVVLEGLTGSLRYTHSLESLLGQGWRVQGQLASQRLKSDDRVAFPFGCTDSNGVDYYADRYCPNGDFDLYDFRSENERRRQQAAKLELKGQINTAGITHDLRFGLTRSTTQDRFQRQAFNFVGTGNLSLVRGGTQVFTANPTLSDENTNRDEQNTEFAAFDAIAWTPAFTTWLGLRHTRLTRASVRTDGSRASRSQRSLSTPFVAASYQVHPTALVYASYGEGAESEVAPARERYTNAGQNLPLLKSRQVELGIKGELPLQGQGLRYSLAYFDIKRPQSADSGTCSLANSCTRQIDGQAEHQGLELSGGTRLAEWELNAGVSLIDAKRSGSQISPTLNGLAPTNVPESIVRLQADYRPTALPGLRLQGHLSREGQRAVLPDNSLFLPAWTRLDAAVHYDTRIGQTNTTFTLGIDNLLDKRYFKESPYQFSHAYLFPGAPRTLRLAVHASL
ncbi:MAG: TonB-dependent siderophore receptor [Burkholderiales bacterium]